MTEKESQISQVSQTLQPRYPACVVNVPGGPIAVAMAKRIYLTADPDADFKAVAERMYRALCGVNVSPFTRKKGVAGLPKKGRA
jgi:hypothetical protein